MKRLSFLFAAACLLLAACTSNINVFLPRGEDGKKGEDGKSAYELWLESVAQGVDNPHTDAADEWPKDQTDIHDYYNFLSGEDGLDGKDGAPAMGGGSGGGNGDDGDDGAPGKSAWELWVDDVTDADGLDNPHTPAPGDEWPRTETSLADFWRYLSADGEQSHNTIVEPGSPGIDFNPVIGKPNVIAVYQDQAHSEYVHVQTGAVTYQVYLASGAAAEGGVSVSGLPRVSGTFTTAADGTFVVPASLLPTTGTVQERYGSVQVDGAPSATNTYVPQKMSVRLMIGRNNLASPLLTPQLTGDDGAVLNGGVYVDVPVRAQRRITDTGAWQDLPDYMAGVVGSVNAYAIDNSGFADPTGAPLPRRASNQQNLRGVTVGVRRPTLEADWLMDANTQRTDYYMYEDGVTPDAFVMKLDADFYGEQPHANAGIAFAPVNFHPLPIDLVMSATGQADVLTWRSGSFDTGTIALEGRYAASYNQTGGDQEDRGDYATYGPVQTNLDGDCLGLVFVSPDGVTTSGQPNYSSIGNPDYTINSTVYVGSTVYLQTTKLLVAGTGKTTAIGTLIEDSGVYVIRATAPFTFPDITITLQ